MSYYKTQCLTGATHNLSQQWNIHFASTKNEYQPAQLNYIKGVFNVVEESANTITIIGDEINLNKVMSAIFVTDNNFKAIFPEYVTVAERRAITRKELNNLKDQIATTLCRCIRDGVTDDDFFTELRDFYLARVASKIR